jgi:hypothetical protein
MWSDPHAPSHRVRHAQQIRQARRHRLGMVKREDMDEHSITVSATATIVAIFFLLAIGATAASFYFMNRCLHGEHPGTKEDLAFAPLKLMLRAMDPMVIKN